MPELIAHLVGDYVLQSHWMAARKRHEWWPALVHAFFYSLPFLLLLSWDRPLVALAQWLLIAGTHAVIDHYGLAAYWCRWWGVGVPGALPAWLLQRCGWSWVQRARPGEESKLVLVRDFPGKADAVLEPAPPHLAVWLVIIVDNCAHLCLNALALHCLPGLF